MTMVLKLDGHALNTLFPDGSAARLELQQAVIANFIQAHVKPAWLGDTVKAQIETAQTAAVNQVLREMNLLSGYSNLTIPDSLKLKFKEAAREAVVVQWPH
jgi:hypothetical protein